MFKHDANDGCWTFAFPFKSDGWTFAAKKEESFFPDQKSAAVTLARAFSSSCNFNWGQNKAKNGLRAGSKPSWSHKSKLLCVHWNKFKAWDKLPYTSVVVR
jgi:hypothetical protein